MIKNTRILFFIFFVASHLLYGQSKWDKMIGKAEAAYVTGDYAKANKYLAKFKKKSTKKLGAENAYTPTYYLLLAKYKLAAGQVLDFDNTINSAITTSIKINLEDSKNHGLLLLEIAQLYNLNGSFRTAREFLDQSKKILDRGDFLDKTTEAKWYLAYAETLGGQGFYNEAIKILKGHDAYFAGRALRQETYVDDNGNLKSRKLSTEEAEERFGEYAKYATLLAKIYGEKGSLISADSAFVGAGTWIDKNLGSSSMPYIRNQLFHAKMLILNGNENSLPRDLEFARTLNSLKAHHKASHYIAVELYEEYLKQLLGSNNSARYLNTKLEFEKMINSNFEKGSIYSVRLKAVDFDSKKSKDKTRNLESDAMNMLANTAGLPRNNVTTIRVIQFLYDLAIQQKNFVNAEKYLNDIIEIKKELYGPNAPLTHLARIHLANYYVDYTNKLNEASAIYKESFDNSVEKEIGAWHEDNLEILNHVGILYELTDKYKEATQALDKASDVSRSKYSDMDY